MDRVNLGAQKTEASESASLIDSRPSSAVRFNKFEIVLVRAGAKYLDFGFLQLCFLFGAILTNWQVFRFQADVGSDRIWFGNWTFAVAFAGMSIALDAQGGTFGKRLLRIRVESSNGSPPGLMRSFRRNIFSVIIATGSCLIGIANLAGPFDHPLHAASIPVSLFATLVVVLGLAGWIASLLSNTNRPNHLAWHDEWAGTVVTYVLPPERVLNAPRISHLDNIRILSTCFAMQVVIRWLYSLVY